MFEKIEVYDSNLIVCVYGIGDSVDPIENLSKCMEEGKATITHEKGTVMLLNFWEATRNQPC